MTDPELIVAGVAAAAAAATSLSPVAVKLLDLVKDVTGVVVDPTHRLLVDYATAKGTVVKAKADAEAQLIRDGVTDPLVRRAFIQLVADQVRRRANLEAIVIEAVDMVPPEGSPDPVDPDWFATFADFSKDVSEPMLRTVWAKLLAAEVTEPGVVSRKTLQDLQVLASDDARVFAVACSLALYLEGTAMLPTRAGEAPLCDLTYSQCLQLDACGLLHVKATMLPVTQAEFEFRLSDGRVANLMSPQPIQVTVLVFTRSGVELSEVVEVRPPDSYIPELQRLFTASYNATLTVGDVHDVNANA